MIDPVTPAHERLGWLEALIIAHRQEHDWGNDPDATHCMLRECEELLTDLLHALPGVEVEVGQHADFDGDEIPF